MDPSMLLIPQHRTTPPKPITHTDAQIGRILSALKDSGQDKNTIIVVASDNGLAVGSHGLMGKQNVYEHSLRVPLIVAGPDIPQGQTRRQLCYVYDIYPTLCERAGLKTPDTVEFKSLNEVIGNQNAPHRQHLYFAFMSWQRAIRDARYKLIEYCVGDARHTQLFDLAQDSEEMKNLAEDNTHARQLQQLRQLLEEEAKALNDGNVPFEFTNNQGQEFWARYKQSEKN